MKTILPIIALAAVAGAVIVTLRTRDVSQRVGPNAAGETSSAAVPSGQARDDMDRLLDTGINTAVHLLEMNGEFIPFGVAIQSDGKVGLVQGMPGNENDRPTSKEVLAFLCPALKSGMLNGNYKAIAVVTNMTVRKTPADEPKDALRVQMEHPGAAPITCYLTYRLDSGKFVRGELTAQPGEPLSVGTEK